MTPSVCDELKEKYLTHCQDGALLKPLVSEHRELLLPLLFHNEEMAKTYKSVASMCGKTTGKVYIKPGREEQKGNEVWEHPGEIVGEISAKDTIVSVTLLSTLVMYGLRTFEDAVVAVIRDAPPAPIEQLVVRHAQHGKYEVQQVPPSKLVYLVQDEPQNAQGERALIQLLHIAFH